MKTDAQIQTEVMEAMEWNPAVTHENIGVSVKNGIVTLSGTVPGYIEKSSAELTAQTVSGVKAVVEKIEIKSSDYYDRNDQDIAEAVKNTFKWNYRVPNTIKVKVEEGLVILSGEVHWDFERAAAEAAVKVLQGVKGIVNEVKIKAIVIQPSTVKEKIERALKARAQNEASRITVIVKGTAVTLSGDVDSFADIDNAEAAAWCAAGVTRVNNQLEISEYH
jgi:osmotically-inducible protein OsmY